MLKPAFECVSPGNVAYYSNDCNPDEVVMGSQCNPCNPCGPDQIRGGEQCNPCNPCGPDQVRGGEQCNPCNPCGPDQIRDSGQCNPCNPCGPDQLRDGEQCNPCNPCGPDQIRGDSGSSSGCFLTSACVETFGLPDDCDELQTLREFRDRLKKIDKNFAELVKEYYRIAPPIVAKINAQVNFKEIYRNLYYQMVLPCVAYIKCGKDDEAVELYTMKVRELQAVYGGG